MLHNIDTYITIKEVAHLDGWDRDGSRSFIESLCEFV
jgi:hypothetical protein